MVLMNQIAFDTNVEAVVPSGHSCKFLLSLDSC